MCEINMLQLIVILKMDAQDPSLSRFYPVLESS